MTDALDGIPDLFTTRCVLSGFAAICLVFAIGLPVAFVIDPPANAGAGSTLLFLLLIALLALLVFLCARAILRAGTWFRVDSAGFHRGTGVWNGSPPQPDGVSIEWKHIVANPKASSDVSIHRPSGGGRAILPAYLRFWYQDAKGDPIQRALPLRLIDDGMQCIRYRNHDALLRAVLLGMAARPGLRFEANVFVEAGIHPETWETMKAPRRAGWGWVALATALVAGFGAIATAQTWSPTVLILGIVAIIAGCITAATKDWMATYPDLIGLITFRTQREET